MLKTQKPCSRVAAVYIYINQLFSKRFSSKSKHIINNMLKLMPKLSTKQFKCHWTNDAKKHWNIITQNTQNSSQKESPRRDNEPVCSRHFSADLYLLHTPTNAENHLFPFFLNEKKFSTLEPFTRVRPTSAPWPFLITLTNKIHFSKTNFSSAPNLDNGTFFAHCGPLWAPF